MNTLTFFNKKIYVTGDLHGNFTKLIYYLKNIKLSNAVVIIAGDIGLGFEKKSFYTTLYNKKMSKFLENNDVSIICLRGNHDDPTFFNGENRLTFPNLITVPDYSVLMFYDNEESKTLQHAILCIGGATSIDRTNRMFYDYERSVKYKSKKCKTYWENEQPFYDLNALEEIKDINIDIVVSHTAPSFVFSKDKEGIGYWLLIDPSLEKDLIVERLIMDNIYNTLIANGHTIKHWFYGHFHNKNVENIDGTTFRLLNCVDYNFDMEGVE